MKTISKTSTFTLFFLLVFFIANLNAQNRVLVWADEFDQPVDFSEWNYDTGPSNDNIHYYTNRSQNLQVVDGVLKIISLEENYMGFDYTSASIRTKKSWKYGRFEALIKLPAGNGFVPAFWMLPADNIYGWWPNSGEIDIMEHPTNEVSTIYGTIHSEAYNLFDGSTPPGATIEIPDAETAFHLYAIEWTPNKIDFFVDGQKYFTFNNDQGGSATWPFDQRFYLILNLAVGGGWVGNPDENTVFPAVMEIDYVRVYQYFDDISIQGADFLSYFDSQDYSVADMDGATYSWEIPGNAEIVSGQNTNQVNVDWNYFGGDVEAKVTTAAASRTLSFPVKVSPNLLKNPGFEKGVKYWNGIVGFPAKADLSLTNNTVFYGNQSLEVDIQTLGANPWDIQCSQKNIAFQAGEDYILRFWAKTDNPSADINVALISFDPFVIYHSESIQLTNNWKEYEINYTATNTDLVDLNIDLGFQTGTCYLDNFLLTTPELLNGNQIKNGDFFDADSNWNFVTLSFAQANSSVIDGENKVSITNGGNEVWEVHLGQEGINVEQGKKYTVTFDAYAEDSRDISVLVGKNSEPWTVYHNPQTFTLSTEKQTFSYSFTMNDPSDNQARFGFDIGKSTIDLYFDNVHVSSGLNPVAITETPSLPKSTQLFQNYPNPFNPSTRIKYQLQSESDVEIIVYDLNGQEIETLIKKRQSAGTYEIKFDAGSLASGIYVYKLKTDQFVQSRKMLLLR